MHILINMNYIGFYLCYLLQTAKLINVLSSVLTQLFRKVKEVQHNFLCAARNIFSGEEVVELCSFKRHTTTTRRILNLGKCSFQMFELKRKFAVELSVYWGKMPLWHSVTFCIHLQGITTKVRTCPPSSCASFQLIAHFLMLMVLGWG